MEVIDAIKTRRSIGLWKADAPPREDIERLLEAAVQAPNHHETQPWRFFVLSGPARERFGEALADALIRRMTDLETEKLRALAAAERNKPLRAPVLIVVASKHSDNPRIVPVEDLQACSAAIQNMLLAAHAIGLSAQWKTGRGLEDTRVKAHFGLSKEDTLAGVVYVGYAADGAELSVKPRNRNFADHTDWLGWD